MSTPTLDERDWDGAKRDLETRLLAALRRERKVLEERLLAGSGGPSTPGIALPGGRYGSRTVIEGRGGFMPNVECCTSGPDQTRPDAFRPEDV